MTSSKAPWDEMKTPDRDYTVRYVTALGDVNHAAYYIYWRMAHAPRRFVKPSEWS